MFHFKAKIVWLGVRKVLLCKMSVINYGVLNGLTVVKIMNWVWILKALITLTWYWLWLWLWPCVHKPNEMAPHTHTRLNVEKTHRKNWHAKSQNTRNCIHHAQAHTHCTIENKQQIRLFIFFLFALTFFSLSRSFGLNWFNDSTKCKKKFYFVTIRDGSRVCVVLFI